MWSFHKGELEGADVLVVAIGEEESSGVYELVIGEEEEGSGVHVLVIGGERNSGVHVFGVNSQSCEEETTPCCRFAASMRLPNLFK